MCGLFSFCLLGTVPGCGTWEEQVVWPRVMGETSLFRLGYITDKNALRYGYNGGSVVVTYPKYFEICNI